MAAIAKGAPPDDGRDHATRRVIDQLKLLYKQKLMPVEQLYMCVAAAADRGRCRPRPLTLAPPASQVRRLPLAAHVRRGVRQQAAGAHDRAVLHRCVACRPTPSAHGTTILSPVPASGKTSFIKYLLGREFPGIRVGPEPTTDRFVAVLNGPDERVVPGACLCCVAGVGRRVGVVARPTPAPPPSHPSPGNALAVSPDLPYRGLERFGTSFLNKFEGSQLPSKVLENITLVDTPGVLSGEKQRLNRGYQFVDVCQWFAARSDLILLLFDAHKLDISDEFRNVIEKLKGEDDKVRCISSPPQLGLSRHVTPLSPPLPTPPPQVRCILNKADQVDRQKLMRVYGALMWAMGKVLKTPEVLRVYVAVRRYAAPACCCCLC